MSEQAGASSRNKPEKSDRSAPGAALFFVSTLVFGAVLMAAGCSGEQQPGASRLTLVTQSGRHPITLEVADTEEKKRLGLMFRTELKDGHGMLFPYDRPQEITMWMRNTYISLDMIFIGADGTVVRVARNTEPMSEAIISSDRPALGVLELKAGAADHYKIQAGKSWVEYPHFSGQTAP
ncbi:MAG TPA: DUF192 domain-containing protein [Hyphomicrobiaceae bacterium]|nr:DUF192 domain-containing protein [Hyphomicrobiaceae bacterium]